MSSRRREINLQLNQLTDALLLGAVFYLAYELRRSGFLILDSLWEVPDFPRFLWILAIVMPFGPFLLEMQGFYSHPLEKTPAKSFEQIVRAGFWLALMLTAAAFFLRLQVPSRSVLVVFAVIAPLVLLVKDRVLAFLYRRRLERGGPAEQVIVAGDLERVRQFEASLSPLQRLESAVVERVDLIKDGVDVLVEALHAHSVGRVILVGGRMDLPMLQRAVAACETEGVEAWLSADFIQTSVARPTFESFGRRPMLVFRATPEVSWAVLIKGGLDRLGAALLLVVLSPLLLGIAVAVRLTSPGPVIFRQRRAGLFGRPFTMFKFRTMVADAEEKRRELERLNEMRGPVFKVGNDPRITPLGRILRKFSLDELPQLVNVLRGEMSLVGPRPLPLYEVARFESLGHRRRLSMKPGLTCLWQVRGRNEVVDFDDWVRMDLEYIDNWTLGLDFVILLRTIPAVLRGWGAR